MYSVKECYFTLQGEGAQAGRAAVFLRFAGCNLWNGLETSRGDAICTFCDTQFVGTDGPGGGRFSSAAELAQHVSTFWPKKTGATPYVVCTGGEPLLQLDRALITQLKVNDFEIAVETNGTIAAPDGLNWICVSPKASAHLCQVTGSELKLVYPQDDAVPSRFEALEFDYFFLQPMDGPALKENTEAAVEFCRKNPKWRLSVQTHKFLGLP